MDSDRSVRRHDARDPAQAQPERHPPDRPRDRSAFAADEQRPDADAPGDEGYAPGNLHEENLERHREREAERRSERKRTRGPCEK